MLFNFQAALLALCHVMMIILQINLGQKGLNLDLDHLIITGLPHHIDKTSSQVPSLKVYIE
jgi:hypothetical protein